MAKSLTELPSLYLMDLDGTMIKHQGNLVDITNLDKEQLLPGVQEFLEQRALNCDKLIIVTGRPESFRKFTEEQLFRLGIHYDQLIMGVGRGRRFLINDSKPDINEHTAIGITVPRNGGLEHLING